MHEHPGGPDLAFAGAVWVMTGWTATGPTVHEHPGGANLPFASAVRVMTGERSVVGRFGSDFFAVVGGLAALTGLPLLAGAACACPAASVLAGAAGQLVVAVHPLWTMRYETRAGS